MSAVRSPLFALLFLSGCLVNQDLYNQQAETLRDDDGDGYAADDCDDNDATRHPGADELCDGEDDNCNGDVDEGAIDRTWYLDADGDGFANPNAPQVSCPPPGPDYHLDADDCEDNDSAIHPNASESCDGVDNNCDGAIDEEPTVDAPYWYLDADSDGYGDASDSTRACEAPSERHIARPGDCDDANRTIFPGAGELCDGVDQDCDGRIDDAPLVDPGAWYPDDDGDGYGDGSSEIATCEPALGFISDNSDCDDTRDSVNPAAVEVCNNGVDDNCNEDPDGCDWPTETDLDDHTIVSGVTGRDGLGYSGAVGDLDGDNHPEIVIGAIYASDSYASPDYHGAVSIFESPVSSVSTKYTSANVLLKGHEEYDQLGSSVVVSDIDGDGVDDLIAGALGVSDGGIASGALYVVYGPHRTSGDIESLADWKAVGTVEWEFVGEFLHSVDDINGDGKGDFAMSLVASAVSSTVTPDGGAVYLFTAAETGETTARESASTVIYSDITSDNLGYGVTSLDLDADGIADIATGAENAGDDNEGLAGIFFGPLGASLDFYDADILWEGLDTSDGFGQSLASGDMNGDGTDDLLVAASTNDPEDGAPGALYMFFGGSSVSPTASIISAGDADQKIQNDVAGLYFLHVSLIGDINSDGAPDIGVHSGHAAVYYGPFAGGSVFASTYDVILRTTDTDGESSLPFMLNGGDLFDDGADELVIGSSDYDGGESVPGYGRTYIIPGVTW
jgi:hypothetical protein